MESFKRRQLQRQQAKARTAEVRRRQAASRTGQVVRSSVPVGDVDVPVVEGVASAVEAVAVLPLVEAGVADALAEAYDAGMRVDEAMDAAVAAAVAAAEGSALAEGAADAAEVARLAAVAAQADATAAQGTADTARAEAASKSAAAEQAAKDYAAIAADTARSDAEIAAAADALEKANAAEAAAKAVANAAQSTANTAVTNAATADGKAVAANEVALQNARYRLVDGGTLTPPAGGFRVGAQRVLVRTDGVPYQIDRWSGTAWVFDQVLTGEVLVVGSGGVVRIADGKVTAPALAVDALDFKSATGMDLTAGKLTGAEINGGTITQTGSSLTGSATYPVTPSSFWRWGSISAAASQYSEMTFTSAIIPPTGGSTHSVMMVTGGTYDTSVFFIPAEFGRYATLSVSFWVRATSAATFGFNLVGTTPSVATTLAAGVWTKMTQTVSIREAGKPIWFRSSTPTGVFYVSEPEITVTSTGVQRAQLVTDGGLSKLKLAGGLSAATALTMAEFSGAQLRIGQLAAENGAGSVLTVDNSSMKFSDQSSTSVNKRIDADGALAISAESLSVRGRSNLTFVGAVRFMDTVTMQGNMFSLKSQLDAWTTAIDGTHAWVTSEGREYVRAGGVWQRVPVMYGGTTTLSVSAATGATTTVAFPSGFFPAGSTPVVSLGKHSGGGAKYVPYAQTVTATGMTLGVFSGDGSPGTASVIVSWQAVVY